MSSDHLYVFLRGRSIETGTGGVIRSNAFVASRFRRLEQLRAIYRKTGGSNPSGRRKRARIAHRMVQCTETLWQVAEIDAWVSYAILLDWNRAGMRVTVITKSVAAHDKTKRRLNIPRVPLGERIPSTSLDPSFVASATIDALPFISSDTIRSALTGVPFPTAHRCDH